MTHQLTEAEEALTESRDAAAKKDQLLKLQRDKARMLLYLLLCLLIYLLK